MPNIQFMNPKILSHYIFYEIDNFLFENIDFGTKWSGIWDKIVIDFRF